jgi:endonuclease/exonuclease/phosphatase family metal-dependent hydrolase
MPDIKIAFWNLQNLFDTTASELATDFEFTPAQGWTQAVFDTKVKNLAAIIKQMHGGQGPDLLGLCEVENKSVIESLLTQVGRADYEIAHIDSPDLRGIDTTLVYSNQVFDPPAVADIVAHNVYLRFATRDIFQVRLQLKGSATEINVLVNHWPSRRQGQYESEPHRMTVAEHCGRIADGLLKFTRAELLHPAGAALTLQELNDRWNRNILIMGDLNDEPFNRSVLDYLRAGKDLDHVEEQLKPAPGKPLPEPKTYLSQSAFFFNAMWPLLGPPDQGTFYLSSATNSFNLLDQFIVSRGLCFGEAGLKLDTATVEIFRASVMTTPKGRPKVFDKTTAKGYSDHFPITAVIKTV